MQASTRDPGGGVHGPLTAVGPEDELHVAFSRLFRRLRRLTAAGGLDPALVGVLHEVSCAGPIRASVLADAMHLDQSTVSRHVRNLEQLDLVERNGDPDDRRAALLSISPAGRDRLNSITSQRRAQFRAATAGWPAQDRVQLARLIDRLAVDLDSANPAVTDRRLEHS